MPFLLLVLIPLFLLGLCFLYLQVEINVRAGDTLSWQISPSILWLKKDFRFRLIRTQQHHEVLYLPSYGTPHCLSPEKMQSSSGKRLLQSLRKDPAIRRYLFRRIRRFRLSAEIVVHADHAASTAMVAGILHIISLLAHIYTDKVAARILPGFTSQRTCINARCIFSLRVGTLLITTFMMLLDSVRQQFQGTGR